MAKKYWAPFINKLSSTYFSMFYNGLAVLLINNYNMCVGGVWGDGSGGGGSLRSPI